MNRGKSLVVCLVVMNGIAWSQNASDRATSVPNIRLIGDGITDEAMSNLKGHDWNCVTLVDAKFSGNLVDALRHASSIRTLRLFGTELSGQIPRLGQVAKLIDLEISTPLSGADFEAIGRLTQLERLSLHSGVLHEVTINVIGAMEIAKLTRLKALHLYRVNIDDASFAELRTLGHLEELDLTHARLTDEGLRTLSHMPNLRRLELSRHPRYQQKLSNACLTFVAELAQLEQLSLSGDITNEGLLLLTALPKLQSLSLIGTNIDGYGLIALKDASLESLTLTPEQARAATDEGTQALTALRKWRFLKRILVVGEITENEMHRLQTQVPDVSWSFSS